MKKGIIRSAAAILCAAFIGLSCCAFAAAPEQKPSSSSNAQIHGCIPPHCQRHGDFSALELLAEITGTDKKVLAEKYPQKTPWQIAKSLNKLDELKSAYIEKHKACIDSLVNDKKLTSEYGAQILAEIKKRVAAIDGINTVIL